MELFDNNGFFSYVCCYEKNTSGLALFALFINAKPHSSHAAILSHRGEPLADMQDELKIVDQLIIATTEQLDTQKQLKELMLQFKKQRENFVQGDQSKAHAGRMVRTARQVYEMIAANHLEHLFAKDYLDELTFFASIAGKSGVNRP